MKPAMKKSTSLVPMPKFQIGKCSQSPAEALKSKLKKLKVPVPKSAMKPTQVSAVRTRP